MKSEQIVECILCGELSELKHEAYPGYQKPDTFNIYNCPSCNTAFSLPRRNDTKNLYNIIYFNGYKIPGYDRYWRYSKTIKDKKNPLGYICNAEDTFWGVRKALGKLIQNKKSAKVLEVGSGLGYLTYALNIAGYDAYGLDISETAVQQAKLNFGDYYISDDLFAFVEKRANYFDVVILTEVIEHVNKPIGFIGALLKLLKHGGHIVLTTPNKSFYPPDIIWNTESPPVHCWWFSEMSIVFIANKLNAKINFIDFSSFCKKRYDVCNLTELRNNPLRMPILDRTGHVLNPNKQQATTLLYNVYRLLFHIPFVISIYKHFIELSNHNIIVCGLRSYGMCAILEKN